VRSIRVDPCQTEQWHSAARAASSQQQLPKLACSSLDEENNSHYLPAVAARDLQRLRDLIAGIRRDQIADRPLRNYRELFRVVRRIVASRREGVKT
jgi:ribosomal 50S subunit-associated protein YjgA (DUF615 family)